MSSWQSKPLHPLAVIGGIAAVVIIAAVFFVVSGSNQRTGHLIVRPPAHRLQNNSPVAGQPLAAQ